MDRLKVFLGRIGIAITTINILSSFHYLAVLFQFPYTDATRVLDGLILIFITNLINFLIKLYVKNFLQYIQCEELASSVINKIIFILYIILLVIVQASLTALIVLIALNVEKGAYVVLGERWYFPWINFMVLVPIVVNLLSVLIKYTTEPLNLLIKINKGIIFKGTSAIFWLNIILMVFMFFIYKQHGFLTQEFIR